MVVTPAVALGYMAWLRGWQLDDAYTHVTTERRCSPRIESLRAATVDMLLQLRPIDVAITHPRGSWGEVRVAGLDVGWNDSFPLALNPATQRLEAVRSLMPGRYPFKFIIDGRWTYSVDYPTYADGSNTNNYLEVVAPLRSPEKVEAQRRLLSNGGAITPPEREALKATLMAAQP
jgi:hypothetical protein